MQRQELLPLVVQLGRAFRERGMNAHLAKLRVYYFAVQKGLTSGAHELDVRWSERFVLDWLKTLRVPPYEDAIPLRPRSSGCETCRARGDQPWIYTDGLFPGGVRMRCQTCGETWLEEDPEPTPP